MPSTRRPYKHRQCPACRAGRDFKVVDNERDEHGRRLMVCTRCNHEEAQPGQFRQSG